MNMKKLFSCIIFVVTVFNSNAWANTWANTWANVYDIPRPEHYYFSCTAQIVQVIPYESRKKIHWDLCIQQGRAQSVASRYNISLEQALRLVPL